VTINRKGDWSENSPLWTKELREEINPVFDAEDGNFWISWKDFLRYFKCVNICKVRNWNEVRIKGKFMRVQVNFSKIVKKILRMLTIPISKSFSLNGTTQWKLQKGQKSSLESTRRMSESMV